MTVMSRTWTRAISLGAAIALGSCGGGGSAPPVDFWVSGGIVAADFNGDGRQDVAVLATHVNHPPPHEAYLEVYLQTAAGTMASPVTYRLASDPWNLRVADLDGDGGLDLIATTSRMGPVQINTVTDSGVVELLYSNAAVPGTFLPARLVQTAGHPMDTVAGRLAGGAAPDLLQDAPSGGVRVFPQRIDALSEFGSPIEIALPAGATAWSVAVADLDRDGRDDIVVASSSSVFVLHQQAAGSFAPAQLIGGGGIAFSSILVTDLDGGGRPDIVASDEGNVRKGSPGGSAVMVFIQGDAGTFAAPRIPLADGAQQVAAGDLDGDGVPDLAVISLVYQSSTAWHGVTVLRQSSAQRGAFTVSGTYEGPYTGNFLAVADVNGDGRNDIVINDGPGVLLQSATQPGYFGAFRSL